MTTNKIIGIIGGIKVYSKPKKRFPKRVITNDIGKTATIIPTKCAWKDRKEIIPRKYPNCIGTEEDYAIPAGRFGHTEYYPEDIEKMKNMTVHERLEYKSQLIKEGRCIDVWDS